MTSLRGDLSRVDGLMAPLIEADMERALVKIYWGDVCPHGIAMTCVLGLAAGQNQAWRRPAPNGSHGFGGSVCVNEGRVLVGAAHARQNGHDAGLAFLFDSEGDLVATIEPPAPEPGDLFGVSVAMDGDLAVIGAHGDDEVYLNSGAAYIFDLSTGAMVHKLVSGSAQPSDHFGRTVAIDSGRVVIGAQYADGVAAQSGKVFVYDVTTGAQLFEWTPADAAGVDYFGKHVAIEGDRVVIGAHHDDNLGSGSGAAYVFDASTGSELLKLLPIDGAAGDWFGTQVAVSGDLILVGAPWHDENGTDSGAAYVFDAVTGQQLQKLMPTTAGTSGPLTQGALFGFTVSLDGTRALVGAPFADGPAVDSGAAYLFDVVTGAVIHEVFACDGAAEDRFGTCVSLEAGVEVIGAAGDDDADENAGAAYVYHDESPRPQVRLAFSPEYLGVFAPGSIVAVDLTAHSCEYSELELGRIDVIVAYDPEALQLIGSDDSATTVAWASSGFLPDPDGINDDLIDGEALFSAESSTTAPGVASGDGVVLTTLRFLALSEAVGTRIRLRASAGVAATTRVLDSSIPPQSLTGDITHQARLWVLPAASSYCTGTDGSCPCGNGGDAGQGCRNSTGSGAWLATLGSQGVAADDFSLRASGLPPNQFGVFFMGGGIVLAPFGDGLRCVAPGATGLHRFPIRLSDSTGGMTSPPVVGLSLSFPLGDQVQAGSSYYFQAWYRDPGGPCGAGWNLSHALAVAFGP